MNFNYSAVFLCDDLTSYLPNGVQKKYHSRSAVELIKLFKNAIRLQKLTIEVKLKDTSMSPCFQCCVYKLTSWSRRSVFKLF